MRKSKNNKKTFDLIEFLKPNKVKLIYFIVFSAFIGFFLPLYSCEFTFQANPGGLIKARESAPLFSDLFADCDLTFLPIYNILFPYLLACGLVYLLKKYTVLK
ncbi:MAG: hypothetical protein AABX01_02030 [Candidatus Micrarchaeota archaeon]